MIIKMKLFCECGYEFKKLSLKKYKRFDTHKTGQEYEYCWNPSVCPKCKKSIEGVEQLGIDEHNKTFEYNADEEIGPLKEIYVPNEIEVGNRLMYYVVQNYPKEERMNAIREILNTFATDFLLCELPKGELELLRKKIERI